MIPRSYFHHVFGMFLCIQMVIANTPLATNSSPLKNKIRTYEKYLRSGQIQTPGSMKSASRPLRRSVVAKIKPKPGLKVLNEITQSYYQNLFLN